MPGFDEINPKRLPTQLEANPDFQLVRSAAEGMSVYVVGGVVRDLLIGKPRADLDLVVEGDTAPLAGALGGEITEHERFRTATVALESGDVDIAQARAESYLKPGALPVVRPATITDDLARRDFTINAMAFPLSGKGELLDPHGGVDDLRAGVLRILHEGSFVDDPTRALRAARYVARLGFEPEPETKRLLGEVDLSTVSEDRVVAELARIAAEDRPAVPLQLLTSWGVMDLEIAARLADELERLFEGNPEWRSFADPETSILLAAAPSDHPSQLRRRAAKIAKHDPPGSPAQIQVLAHGHVPEVLAIARAAGASWLDDYVARLRHVELEISGEDLIEAGVPEGPAVGRGLNAALSAKLDGEISGHEDELRVALAAAEEGAHG